jgi:hypothetical protein
VALAGAADLPVVGSEEAVEETGES